MDKLAAVLIDRLEGRNTALPEWGALAWGWFLDLGRTRTSNGFGPNPISFAEIESYARLYRWPLQPRHVEMIVALDRVWLDHARKNLRTGHATPTPNHAAQPLSAAAFDAVFS